MDKIIKNERFRNAIDCLYGQKLIESDVDAAKKIGISKSGFSRLLNDRKGVSYETLRKMNDAFGGINSGFTIGIAAGCAGIHLIGRGINHIIFPSDGTAHGTHGIGTGGNGLCHQCLPGK